MNATVKDFMTTPVLAVRSEASFKQMAAMLHRYRVSAFPVLNDVDKVIGVVSATDLLAKEAVALAREALADGAPAGSVDLTAADLMTRPAVTITADKPVESAARLMYNCRVKRLPVVDAHDYLVGIISRVDVLASFDRADEQIQAEIVDRLTQADLLEPPARFAVTVQAGVVTLAGRPETVTLGRELARWIRHIPGVVAVRDRLTYQPG